MVSKEVVVTVVAVVAVVAGVEGTRVMSTLVADEKITAHGKLSFILNQTGKDITIIKESLSRTGICQRCKWRENHLPFRRYTFRLYWSSRFSREHIHRNLMQPRR